MTKTTATAFLLFCGALASPIAGRQEKAARAETSTPEVKEWSAGWVTEFPIHESCNATLRNQLAEALAETQQLAQHAKEHLLRWGHESQFVQKYFGEGNTAVPIGWYERIISADKTGMLFRCDDPDKNCATQSGKLIPNLTTTSRLHTDENRLGWPLARLQRHRGDCHLPSLLREAPPSLLSLQPGLQRRQLSPQHLLGH